jgi:hypothetical protein
LESSCWLFFFFFFFTHSKLLKEKGEKKLGTKRGGEWEVGTTATGNLLTATCQNQRSKGGLEQADMR